jgi:hypothetical protein
MCCEMDTALHACSTLLLLHTLDQPGEFHRPKPTREKKRARQHKPHQDDTISWGVRTVKKLKRRRATATRERKKT